MFAGTLYHEKIKEAHMENSLQFFGEEGWQEPLSLMDSISIYMPGHTISY